MKSFTFALVLAVTLLAVALAEPEPEPAKGDMRYRAAQIIEDGNDEGDMLDDVDDKVANVAIDESGNKKGDASSGRLFMKKFLLFKNMFGNNQKQPIIPIIITGGGTGTGTGTGTTPPTTTVTSTGTVPTATGTITTSPATPEAPTGDAPAGRRPAQRIQLVARGSYDNNAQEEEAEEEEEEAAVVDNQALAAALAAGAQEYIVTDQDIKGTSDAKANRGPARVNLRRRGAKKGQVVSVRIPPKYRGYFQNGQRVILNNSNRPAKRRVVKKRVIRKRNKKNNKRRRVVAQH